jgi:hypothetical protein
MSIADLANISTIVQAVLVIISLGFIWSQLRRGTKLAKAANSQAIAEQALSFNSLLIEHSDVAELWYGGGADFPSTNKTNEYRYRELLVQWLILHENIYYQWNKGLLDPEIYNSWLEDLKYTVKHHNLKIISEDIREIFPGKFGDLVVELSSASRKASLPRDA